MNEIQRLAYLDAIGIDCYISRGQLPGAAPSRRLRIVRAPDVAAVPDDPARGAQAVLSDLLPGGAQRQPPDVCTPDVSTPDVSTPDVSTPDVSTPDVSTPDVSTPDVSTRDVSTPDVSTRDVSTPDVSTPDVSTRDVSTPVDSTPVFSVSACFLAGYCWLSEVPRARELGSDYAQLLRSICKALGWDSGAPVMERFDWPMGNSRQLDQGEEAARHGFEGFIRARLERYPVRGVVLLGEADGAWLERSVFGDIEWHTTVSARDMLKQPELKARAWRDLKPLAKALA